MPSLIVHHGDRTEAGVLDGPVLIGRVRACGVVVESNDVSRVHAWVGQDLSGAYFVADTFSRAGTRVNGQTIRARHRLQDGDEIEIGPARVFYHTNGTATPPGAGTLNLTEKRWSGDAPDMPVHFVCACGATIVVSTFFAGRAASCAYCHAKLIVPKASGQVAGNTAEATTEQGDCSICQCAMAAADVRTTCPGCGLSFHADCWQENKGCSAYGCAQVNVLATPEQAEEDKVHTAEPLANEDAMSFADGSTIKSRVPWLYVALGVGAVGLATAGTVGYLLYVR